MRWHKNRRLGLLAAFSVSVLLLIASCQGMDGSAGSAGPKGDQGVPGAPGASGDIGPKGLSGDAGTSGATGPTGPSGAVGEDGASTAARTILEPGVVAGSGSFQITGSGFTSGNSYSAQILDGAVSRDLKAPAAVYSGGIQLKVNSDGAINGSWSTSVSPGLYTVEVRDSSGVMATAPLLVE